MHEGLKIISNEEMGRIEKAGDHESYMAQAGKKVALCLIDYVRKKRLSKVATLLVGKGNNGGDAYAAGIYLLEKGFEVFFLSLYSEGSFLNEKFKKKFIEMGGKPTEAFEGVLVDGILGTGFHGKLDLQLKKFIEKVNASQSHVIAIDIPSGINGSTGQMDGVAIKASVTVTLGIAKIGLFLKDARNYLGKLMIGDFGLTQEQLAEANPIGYMPKKLILPKICPNRHKYEAGFVVGYAGSSLFPGAPKMAGLAALRSGAGIVKIFHPGDIGEIPFSLIASKWNRKLWDEALEKATAVFVGPGLGECKKWLKTYLKKVKVPCVVDADAIQKDIFYPEGAVLTPHKGEAERLLGVQKIEELELFEKLMQFSNRNALTIVLKGAPTWIFGPGHKPVVLPRGDPGMATAGSGDVLTGVIAALISQGSAPYEASLIGVALHAISGEMAGEKKTSFGMIAIDIIECLPLAFKEMLQGKEVISGI